MSLSYSDPRAIDPHFLHPGDTVVFGSGYMEVKKKVTFINVYNVDDPDSVKFVTFDIGQLYFNDPLWKLARKANA